MSKLKIKTIEVETGVNPSFLENTLTQDISPLASLFDLIDNSIDAARDHLLQSKHVTDKYGLPADYSGYKIHIRIDNNSIRIIDNCLGIEEIALSEKTFYIAGTSEHSFGIGHYGLGLKRSLLKFGHNYAMATDTGNTAFKMRFNSQSFGRSENKKLTADAFSSSGKRKVLFSVSNLKTEVKYEISSDRWFDNAIRELSIRYAVYVSKGLQITIRSLLHHQSQKICSSIPGLRTNGKFPPSKAPPLEIDGVQIYIESGIHQDYLFPSEEGSSIAKNKLLTKFFGLYFICNDRVIVASNLSADHGWKTTWHSEYNGFVCLIRFISKNSSKMPWNTAKTAMRTDSTIFLKVRDQLQPIADFYRKDIKRRYPKKTKPNSLTGSASLEVKPPQPLPSLRIVSSRDEKNGTVVMPLAKAIDNPHLHVKNWTTLLPTTFPHTDDNVLNALIIEAVGLELSKAPYAAAMLYRAIMEAALKRFVYRTNNYQNVKNHFYLSSEGKKKNHSEEQKKIQGISTSVILPWLHDNVNLFDDENKSRLTLAFKKSKEHISFLNGVVHGNQLMNDVQLANIRNDTVELLQFLIAKNLATHPN